MVARIQAEHFSKTLYKIVTNTSTYMYVHVFSYTLYIDRNQLNMNKSRLSTVHIFGYMATTPRCIWKGFDKIHSTEKVITYFRSKNGSHILHVCSTTQQSNFNFFPVLAPTFKHMVNKVK